MKTLMKLFLTVAGVAAVMLAIPAETYADSGPGLEVPMAVVDQGAPAAAQPGTPLESREYEAREAASPEVQEFSGGGVVIGVSLLAIAVIVLAVVLLSD